MVKKGAILNRQNQIYDRLKDNIISGKYDGGTFLLESELCEEFNVSRTPVREALIRLSQDRYIEIIPNRGAFIPQITTNDIKELYDIKIANDGMAAFLCSERATPEIIEAMEQSIVREENLLRAEDFVAIGEEDVNFHSIYVYNCGNQRLIDVIDSVNHQLLRVVRLAADKNALEPMQVSLNYHKELVKAIKDNDPSRARAVAEAHWQNNKQSYIMRFIEGTLSNRL